MIIRALDSNGDWTIGKGTQNYATGQQAIEENIKTRLLSWVGDCFFAINDFVDWNARLDVGQMENLQDEVMRVILQSYGVVAVKMVSVVFNAATRAITITYTADTIFSADFQATINQPLGAGS